jgi:hypothetical protein
MAVYKTSNSGLLTRTQYSSFLAGNDQFIPFAPSGAYDSIATATGTGSNTYVEFTSIPSTYTHLQIRISGQPNNPAGGGGTSVAMRINSDTGSNYNGHVLAGNGTNAVGGYFGVDTILPVASIPQGGGASGGTQYMYNAAVIDILDYTNTNKYTTIRALSGWDKNNISLGTDIRLVGGLWLNTSAVNTIRLYANDGLNLSWYTGSTIALYGIKGN